MLDVLSIGDATLDVFVQMKQASVNCRLRQRDCEICFTFADKIPVESLHYALGGNACNNAVGSARLGLRASFWGIVGDDDTGHQIAAKLRREGVSTGLLEFDKRHPTNYSVVINYHAERTILVYSQPRRYHWHRLPRSKWIYFTSIGRKFETLHRRLLEHVRQSGAKLFFNPGTFQLKLGKRLDPVLRATEALILNREEAARLLGWGNTPAISTMLHELERRYRIAKLVITDGRAGAFSYADRQMHFIKPYPGKRVEATGAGDSFATGILAALRYGEPLPQAMLWGAVNAASVVSQIGPQAGLLTKARVLQALRRHPRFQPKPV